MTRFSLESDRQYSFARGQRHVFVIGCMVLIALAAWWLLAPPLSSVMTGGGASGLVGPMGTMFALGSVVIALLIAFSYIMMVRFGEPAEYVDVGADGIELVYRSGDTKEWRWSDTNTRIHIIEATESTGRRIIKLSNWNIALSPLTEAALAAIMASAEQAGLRVESRSANEVFRSVRYLTISHRTES